MQQYKCAIPIITYSDGCLHYICETEGAECITNITDVDIQTHKGNVVRLTATYTINVYATATGYENSDIATATLCWIDAEPKIEGIENRVAQVRANAVLIQSHNGVLSIAGVADGTDIAVYSTSGRWSVQPRLAAPPPPSPPASASAMSPSSASATSP